MSLSRFEGVDAISHWPLTGEGRQDQILRKTAGWLGGTCMHPTLRRTESDCRWGTWRSGQRSQRRSKRCGADMQQRLCIRERTIRRGTGANATKERGEYDESMGETLQIDPEVVSVESKVLPNIRMMF